MAVNINNQKPAKVNQIENTKPLVMKNANVLQGYCMGSMIGGIIKPIGWHKVIAGEHAWEYKKHMYIKMLTPLTPSYQRLKMVVNAFWVPNERVWTNAKKYYAQKGGASEQKIDIIPNLGGLTVPTLSSKLQGDTLSKNINYFDTEIYRDSYVSSYVPRIASKLQSGEIVTEIALPPISCLPLRGMKAIYNDFYRNKEYDQPIQEFFGDTVSSKELEDYFPTIGYITNKFISKNILRGKRQDSYYTNYRTELGDSPTQPNNPNTNAYLFDMVQWQAKISEARQEALNAQKNDWEIIAEMGGTSVANENEVQLIGSREIPLTFTPVTQTSYNVAETLQPEFQKMGTQGAYSFTDAEINLFGNFEFKQNGYIHIVAQVTTDTIFSSGIDRQLLNITPYSEWRPELKNLKEDVLYRCETNTEVEKVELDGTQQQIDYTEILGYKRKFSEYFKLPNIIFGDINKEGFYKAKIVLRGGKYSPAIDFENKIIPNSTYAYIEDISDNLYKKYWKDYTDLYINSNQAIEQEVINYADEDETNTIVSGQNQIFFVGIDTYVCDLPIDENIRDNFTKWGEK